MPSFKIIELPVLEKKFFKGFYHIRRLSWSCDLDHLYKLIYEALHYANMSVQYTAIFHGYKNIYFQTKHCNIFLMFAQNIDCGYTLEPPQ